MLQVKAELNSEVFWVTGQYCLNEQEMLWLSEGLQLLNVTDALGKTSAL